MGMKIEQHQPSINLQAFIKGYTIIESDSEMDNFVLPGTSMVMAIRYKGHVIVRENDFDETLPSLVLSGMRRTARLIHYTPQTANLLIIFNEGGLSALSKIPAHELYGLSLSSENLFSADEMNEILARLSEAQNNAERIKFIDNFLSRKLRSNQPDRLVHQAISLIKQQKGTVRIKDLVGDLYISQDAFEKRFRTAVGATPKQYASIVRLQSLINKHSSFASLTEAAYEAGYFDQSHFIKEFKKFTHTLPSDFQLTNNTAILASPLK